MNDVFLARHASADIRRPFASAARALAEHPAKPTGASHVVRCTGASSDACSTLRSSSHELKHQQKTGAVPPQRHRPRGQPRPAHLRRRGDAPLVAVTLRAIDHADHALSEESNRLSYAAVLFG